MYMGICNTYNLVRRTLPAPWKYEHTIIGEISGPCNGRAAYSYKLGFTLRYA